MYMMAKHLHTTAALISISLFILRAYWSVREMPQLQKKWVKILPHVNDTVLLGAAIYLVSFWPLNQPWIWAKIIALLLYIGVGTVAIKRGKTPRIRLTAAVVSVGLFGYIAGVALAHNPLSWLA